MIRYREFAIQTASLAGLSLAAGCAGPSLEGTWKGTSLITGYGDAFDLPFSFTGTLEQTGWFGGITTREFATYEMSAGLVVAENVATLSRAQAKVYTYTYDPGGEYEPYIADVDSTTSLTYSGTVTQVGDREFDIVMPLASSEEVLLINEELQEPAAGDELTTRTAVLQCGTDGTELHCFQGNDLLIFLQE